MKTLPLLSPRLLDLKEWARKALTESEPKRLRLVGDAIHASQCQLEHTVIWSLGLELAVYARIGKLRDDDGEHEVALHFPGHHKILAAFQRQADGTWKRVPYGACTHGSGWEADRIARKADPDAASGLWLINLYGPDGHEMCLVADLAEALCFAEIPDGEEVPFKS
jgi:hypothetical protein